MDRKLTGVPASPGIAVGTVHLLRWEVPEVPQRIISDDAIPREIARLHEARTKAKERLATIRDRVERTAGPQEAAIFDVQREILDDRELIAGSEALIKQNLAAEKAFEIVMLEWRERFARAGHPMLRERVGDLKDVEIRVLTLLLDLPDHDPVDLPKGANAILVTHDLTPSLTVQLDRDAIAGLATDAGTRTSHVAILARSLGLPAIVGMRTATQQLSGHETAILDGSTGLLAINPTHFEIDQYKERARQEALAEVELRHLASLDAVTTDGVRITLRANVDLPEEADLGATSGAEGVGLMRTEFLVVGRATMPDEDEQYRAYKRVVDAFGGKPVVIRTFDIGGDKLPVGGFPSEPNPFLGWRAIRMCLDQPELFSVQLRALLRAAVHGDVRIMLPLVVTRRRSPPGAQAARRGRGRARGARRRVPARRAARRDDRDAGGGDRLQHVRRRRRVLQHRHERPRAVHARRRSRQRQSRDAIHAAASRGAASDSPYDLHRRSAPPRQRRLRRDGVATAHGVRAYRTRRAPTERGAALGAAREADRAQDLGSRGA